MDDRRRRKYRNRFGADEDIFGEADAEDRADDHSAENLSFGAHAAGLDRDLGYERTYAERHEENQGYDSGYNSGYTPPNQWTSSPPPPPGSGMQSGLPGELPTRAQNLQNRIQRRSQRGYERQSARSQGDGIDGLFDADLNLSKYLPCSNSVLFLLVLMIGGLGCAAMAILAFSSLARHLGF